MKNGILMHVDTVSKVLFNQMHILCLFQEILLTCWPLIRDSSCYIITIGALAFAVADTVIHW